MSPIEKWVFASHNEHKLREVQAILGLDKVKLIGLTELDFYEEIPETGDTLEENALIKTRYINIKTGLPVFSDDTGLEVYALSMAPGVHTARYAGPSKDKERNINKLLDALDGEEDRRARFRTAIALALDGKEYLFEGIAEGYIAKERSGRGGFGYDPVFIPEGFNKSFAELDAKTKNEISHRFKAIDAMRRFLEDRK